jgi:stage III sporulation protein AB
MSAAGGAGAGPGLCLRIVGCLLMLAGTSGCGFELASGYRRRLELLVRLRQMIYLLKGQIVYANATLEEAFQAVGERSEGALGELFCAAALKIRSNPGDPFPQIWSQAVDQMDRRLPVTTRDREALKSMAGHLGYLDRDMQERNLLLYLEELDETIQNLKEHQKEKCRLYTSLGIMSGLFLAVIIL